MQNFHPRGTPLKLPHGFAEFVFRASRDIERNDAVEPAGNVNGVRDIVARARGLRAVGCAPQRESAPFVEGALSHSREMLEISRTFRPARGEPVRVPFFGRAEHHHSSRYTGNNPALQRQPGAAEFGFRRRPAELPP